MKMRYTIPVVALVLTTFSACTSTNHFVHPDYDGWEEAVPQPSTDLAYQVFLIGDAGAPSLDPLEPTLRLLQQRLQAAGEDAAVVFLGDNIYCCGLPDSSDVYRIRSERRLRAQLDAVKDFEGRIVFIPGNHDWNDSRPGGLEAVRRQERYVEDYLQRGNVFLPDEGFPGPVEVELTKRITLVVLDTEWWLQPHDKPYGDTGDYELEEDGDFLLQLADIVYRRRDDDLLVVGHHPIESNGVHGGHATLRDHVFPLSNLSRRLFVPLPVLGSAYPLFSRYFAGRQDLNHPRYRAVRRAFTRTFAQHERLVYAAGHEHNLQYHVLPEAPHPFVHIVSGSGSRPGRASGRDALFSYSGSGFATLKYHKDGTVWLEMWTPDGDGSSGSLLFRTQVYDQARELVDPQIATNGEVPDYSDSTVVKPVNPGYDAGVVKRWLLGRHHRDSWTTPVELPVLDIGRIGGGLTPVKRGGGQQTVSLRLEGTDGNEYVLRSVDKDPSRTVPRELQGTVATDIIQDQISSIHPYGALMIPRLAEAAGVYHTRPRILYVPHDPRLGIYKELFGGKVMMIEERPDDDESDRPNFGGSTNVISPHKLYREIDQDNDHRVDQHAFLRARLFDMLISDWDRHRDQWRWASYEPYELDSTLVGEARTEGKIYRPIPRDRDWAFNKMNGLFPSLAPFFDPKFQDFEESYGNLKGLTLNGLEQDRRFLNALTRDDFVSAAERIRTALTDAVVDSAVRALPEPIYSLHGEKIAHVLKVRRDRLPVVAASWYEQHARIVDIVGSHKHERFEVTHLGRDSTRIVVLKTSKDGEIRKEIYRRVFHHSETDEVRLYGLAGDDRFIITGEGHGGLHIIAVGGTGNDVFADRARVRGRGMYSHFYDTQTGNTWELGPRTRVTRSDDPAVNLYDPMAFQHDVTLPMTFFGSNKDDGIFVGGGVRHIRHGFRKRPYAAMHVIKGNVASKTQAFNVVYGGHYVSAVGPWDVLLDVAYLSPNNIRNFYGLGNETENEAGDREFYQARLTQFSLAPSLMKRYDPGLYFRIGPTFQVTRVREDEDRVVAVPQPGISNNTFEDQWYAGLEMELLLETVDHAPNPRRGFQWSTVVDLNAGIRNATDSFTRLSSAAALYLSPSYSPQITVAVRTGAAHNIGSFPFFSANTLGGAENLHGYRSTRFAGRTSFYQNVELRAELIRFSTYLAIGRAGLLGFFDHGRVWTDGEESDLWHQGYGGGLWVDLFNTFVFTGTAGFSDDDETITLKLGFLF